MRAKIISAVNDPALYPWSPPSEDVFVSGKVVVPFKGKVARVPHRYPVVAVGSNACVDVMKNKFNQRLEGIQMPWVALRATIRNMAIGAMPLMSPRGYVPATPFAKTDAVTKVWVSFFDQAHLDALDSTEPGYTRLKLSSDKYLLTLDRDGQKIDEFFVYEADKGYLTDGLSPIEFPITQRQIFEYLKSIENIAPLLPLKYSWRALASNHTKITTRIARNTWMYREPNLEGEKCE